MGIKVDLNWNGTCKERNCTFKTTKMEILAFFRIRIKGLAHDIRFCMQFHIHVLQSTLDSFYYFRSDIVLWMQFHIRVLESTNENVAALLMGLEYLLNISYVDDTEVFKVCCTVFAFL